MSKRASYATGERRPSHIASSFGSRARRPIANAFLRRPLWAHWLGGRAATGQTLVMRIENDSGDVCDVGLCGHETDAATIAQHCGTGEGIVTRTYNALDPSQYIKQTDTAKCPIIYENGAVVRGANGYVCARFRGGFDSLAVNVLKRDDALGLTGASAVTLAGDASLTDVPANSNFDSIVAWIGGTTDAAQRIFSVDLGYDGISAGYGVVGATLSAGVFDTDTVKTARWWRADIAAGANIRDARFFLDGALQTRTGAQGSNLPLNLLDQRFAWGWPGSTGNASPQGGMSSVFAWDAVLSDEDAARLDAWQRLNHA